MKMIYPAILAGAAIVGLTAFALPLAKTTPAEHTLTVALPSGDTETITYTGDAVPRVTVNPDRFATAFPSPAFGFAPSFIALDSMAFDTGLEAALRQAETLAGLAALADGRPLPLPRLQRPGLGSSAVSTSVADQACMRVVQITQRAGGAKPEVVSSVWGACDAVPDTTRTAGHEVPALKPINTRMIVPAPARTPT